MRTSPGSQNEPRPVDEGMTLPELLVAMGLFSLLTLLICTTSILGYRIATNLENRTDNATQNQVAVDAISKVLRTAILPDQMADSSCVSCADTAIIQATGTQVSFYANLGDPIGPDYVILQVVQDPNATQTSGMLRQILVPPIIAGTGQYKFCDPTTAGCNHQTRTLARGLTWPATQLFAYYNFDGNQITSSAFSTADLASVASVEVVADRADHQGPVAVPRHHRGAADPAAQLRHQRARAADDMRFQMRKPHDEGSALLMVLGMMMVLSIIVTVAATLAMQTAAFARHSTDWNQALAAAEAGVDDYLARLNADDNYWLDTPDCDNLAMQKPNVSSCTWGSSTPVGWVNVPHSARAQFHYDVNISSTPSNGTIKLTSTGRVGSVKRTVSTVLRRGGFGEFLYYTVYETVDPANEAVYGLNNYTAQDRCTHYAWEPYVAGVSKPRDQSYCQDIQFVSGDKINGPLHSNDTLLMSGNPRFQGTVTTSDPACKPVNGHPQPYTHCYDTNGSASPQFDKGIAYRSEVDLPTSIGDLKQYVDASQTTDPGCLYTGPTRIVFNANPSGQYSTMKVWSPWSKSPLNPGCGNYQGSWPQTIPLPQNKLIMVQDVPSSQHTPSSGACATGAIGDSLPQSNDYNQSLNEADCRYGTLYVQGTLHGRVTLATDNNIVITGDLTYKDGKTGLDALGLIAQNSVKVYHPIKATCTRTNRYGACTSYSYSDLSLPTGWGQGSTLDNVTVQASILTLQHSFTVQAYDKGSALGTLHLFGSFAQRFRGPVGTTGGWGNSTGYLKDYEYDTRLRYSPPPYFLDPVRSSWGMKAYGESTAAY